MRRITRATLAPLLFLGLVFAGCQSGEHRSEPPSETAEAVGEDAELHPAIRRLAATTFVHETAIHALDDKALVDENCGPEFGAPQIQASWEKRIGHTTPVARAGYVLLESDEDRIPLWVCEHVTKQNVTGPLKRPKPEPFGPDPKLQVGARSELSDYKGSGFDRGHMAPSGNQTVDKTRQGETYYLSNMAPQVGKTYNQGIWKALEDMVRHWAEEFGSVYTITGPLITDESASDPVNAEVDYSTIGKDKVAVPTHCYKIVLAKVDGKWKALAFVLPNQVYHGAYHLERYLRSIRWIEEHSGLDFLSKLPAAEQDEIEKQRANALWN